MRGIALAALLVLANPGCASPAGPTPTPTPKPSPTPNPRGIPNATALENVPLVRALEHAIGRKTATVLAVIIGTASTSGVSSPGGGWDYVFGQFVDPSVRLYDWSVNPQGMISYGGNVPDVDRYEITEIEPSIVLDSPEAARRALEYGGRSFVDRYPESFLRMRCLSRGDVVWEVRFADRTHKAPCDLGPIVVSAKTGELVYRDLSCLKFLP